MGALGKAQPMIEYVIVAAIISSSGQFETYNPSTVFDEMACIKEARDINARWRTSGIDGFATCRLEENGGASP